MEGTLTATSGPVQLFALVPARPGRVETIFVHVDQFPRAFAYCLPCNTKAVVAAEELETLAVRIATPSERRAYATPRPSIPAGLQVDAPHLGRGRPDVFVEVGIDADQDGEFRGEAPVRLDSDRQVEIALARTTPQGGLSIATRIEDFSLAVPTRGATNRHVNLLARVVADRKSLWSREIEVVLDGLPPRIDSISLNPAAGVAIGKPVAVLVEASDAGLSGVERVEVAFDVKRTGQFAAKPPPVPAQRTDSGAWRAVLTTKKLKPGPYDVLVRAIDRVGHVSETARARVPVITPQQAAAMKKAALNTRITGVVLFRGQPAPGVTVRLAAKPGKKKDGGGKVPPPTFRPQTAKQGGAFAFPAVPPGQYTLTSSGLLRNKNRTKAIPITVGPDPKPRIDVKINLE